MNIPTFIAAWLIFIAAGVAMMSSHKIILEKITIWISALVSVALLAGTALAAVKHFNILGIDPPEIFPWATGVCGWILFVLTVFGLMVMNIDRYEQSRQNRIKGGIA